jgi:hypothetical protein
MFDCRLAIVGSHALGSSRFENSNQQALEQPVFTGADAATSWEMTSVYARRTQSNAVGLSKAIGALVFGAVCLWHPAWVVSGAGWLLAQLSHLTNALLGAGWEWRAVSAYFAACEYVVRSALAGLLKSW